MSDQLSWAQIPLIDLVGQHQEIADEVAAGMARVLDSTCFIGGPEVAAFEAAFAAASGVRRCVGVGNGTDAIELALRALGLPHGTEVIVPANTFVASVEGVLRAGLRPVLADVDDEHLLLDPAAAEDAASRRTAALLPVHLFGQLADMPSLLKLAAARGLVVVEDAAQSQLARRHGRAAGAWGAAAATSFYPGKNLGAYGDAGAVLTDDTRVADTVRSLGNHGGVHRYQHELIGCNSRLDALQAVVLSAKLRLLERWNDARRAAAVRYAELLAGLPDVRLPGVAVGNDHVWHLYVIRVSDRDAVLAALRRGAIDAGVHYPKPIHRQPAYAYLAPRGAYPVAERAAEQVLSLPMFPRLRAEQQERVVIALAKAIDQAARERGVSPSSTQTDRRRDQDQHRDRPRVHSLALCEGAVGPRTTVWPNAHILAGAVIGADGNVGEGAYVESGARLGDRVTVKNQVLVWDGVTVEDDVFLGPGVTFTNDVRPRSRRAVKPVPTRVRRGATVGARAVVLCGLDVGEWSMVAAGAIVTRDVAAHALVVGNPARQVGWVCRCGQHLDALLQCRDCGARHYQNGSGLRADPGLAGSGSRPPPSQTVVA